MINASEMQATGRVRVTHGREHRYTALGFPNGGRMARTHWDERGRASVSLTVENAAGRVRAWRKINAVAKRLGVR